MKTFTTLCLLGLVSAIPIQSDELAQVQRGPSADDCAWLKALPKDSNAVRAM